MRAGNVEGIRAMLGTLDLDGEEDVPDLAWLDASWNDPAAFWRALFDDARAGGAPLKSKLGVAYDVYADAVQRHATTRRPAFIWYARRTGWRAISYADLDALAGARASSWAAQGVVPGKVVAIVQDFGVDYVVSLAAALRLGACVSVLAPTGDLYLSRRLKNLVPDHVVIDPGRPPPLGSFAEHVLDSGAGGPAPRTPAYTYGPKEPWAQLFSPVVAPVDAPLPVTAERMLLHALRDGAFALGVRPGSVFAAPGAHPTQHAPALLLSVLIAGATYLHIDVTDIETEPALLGTQPLDVLVVGDALRRALSTKPTGPMPRLGLWLKNVDEPLDWAAWRDFVDKNGLGEIAVANLFVDAGEGCCAMFSARRKASLHARALPSAAVPWVLAPTSGTVPGDLGWFARLEDGKADPAPWLVLARSRGEYLFGGSATPRRGARIFPADEVEAWVSSLAPVRGACVVPVASLKAGGGSSFVLCVFADPRAGPSLLSKSVLEQEIATRLGPDAAPDAIEVFDLHPRKEGGKLDHSWCARQYLSGRLTAKSNEPRFQTITSLRAAMARPTPAPRRT